MSVFEKRIVDGRVVRRHTERGKTHQTVTRTGRTPTRHEKPGTVLARQIKWLTGISGTGGCGCKNLQTQMDGNGCDWCDENRGYIVGKMVENTAALAPMVNVSQRVLSSSVGQWLLRLGAERLLSSAVKTARAEAKQRATRQASRPRGVRGRYARLTGSPVIPQAPIPFAGEPRLTLMFHVWPHGDAWKRHLEWLEPQIHRFDRKLLGIAHDHLTATVEDTVAAFEQLSQGWEVFPANNKPDKKGQKGLREVATYQQMLPIVADWNTPNDVTFCLHGKGVQAHTSGSDPIRWWIDAMYDTVYHNIDGVLDSMRSGAAIAGSFKRYGSHFKARHGWHYTGTFYAIRNAIAFSNGIPAYRQVWWGTESWPGDHFPKQAAACLFGDNAQDLYKEDQQPRTELEQWRAARCSA